jgi:hypothetical protein
MKVESQILERVPEHVSRFKNMECIVLFQESGMSKLTLLYGWIDVDEKSTLVYSPHGHGLRWYKEDFYEQLRAYLPVNVYGGWAENKVGKEKWRWSRAQLPLTTVIPSYMWL